MWHIHKEKVINFLIKVDAKTDLHFLRAVEQDSGDGAFLKQYTIIETIVLLGNLSKITERS